MKRTIIPQRFILVTFTFLISVLMYVDRACIGAAKGSVSDEFGLTNIQWAWVMAAFTLGYALMQTPSGKLADKKGARVVMSGIITVWSILTALTGTAWNFVSMIVIRFLFGGGEAGAFPTLSKVVYKWFPVKERGIIQGINFSGSRIGGAVAYPIVVALIALLGWRGSFFIFGAVGLLFAAAWWFYFRNSPEESKLVGEEEEQYILKTRQQNQSVKKEGLSFAKTLQSKNMLLAMVQYIGSNFTFYFTLTWMFPYLKEAMQSSGTAASFWAMAPLIGGAIGNWVSGIVVDKIYKSGNLKLSRRLPAIIGFALAAIGVILMTNATSDISKVLFLTLAIFGADMTLSPSWAFCIDIGKENAGAVSGTMNMAGNLGAFTSILAFGYLADGLIRSGVDPKNALAGNDMFFYICAGLSVLSIIAWLLMNPEKEIGNE
ncbi:MFS transporter [uncultured Draconibacterium sp.]|uniref:MFS transporter n=1 Tax=uncultured Draconibacterium sp. TaxID=1573823 RepID=UPI0029C6F992|nr:MFS transporter [uncultured Draconibacterium sp.]